MFLQIQLRDARNRDPYDLYLFDNVNNIGAEIQACGISG